MSPFQPGVMGVAECDLASRTAAGISVWDLACSWPVYSETPPGFTNK